MLQTCWSQFKWPPVFLKRFVSEYAGCIGAVWPQTAHESTNCPSEVQKLCSPKVIWETINNEERHNKKNSTPPVFDFLGMQTGCICHTTRLSVRLLLSSEHTLCYNKRDAEFQTSWFSKLGDRIIRNFKAKSSICVHLRPTIFSCPDVCSILCFHNFMAAILIKLHNLLWEIESKGHVTICDSHNK